MGIGIVEPVDDFRVSNPASNPELLAELGKRFTDSKYDLKTLVARHLQLADLPEGHPAQRRATPPTSGTSPTPTSGGS